MHITYRQSLQTLDASAVQERKMPGQCRWRWYGHNLLDGSAGGPPSITVVMVTGGHLACGPVTAMRSLSSAPGNRHDQEGEARHRPVGGGRRNGHDRRHPDSRQRGHAYGDQASARAYDPARTGCRGGGHRVRAGGPGGVRHRADRGSGQVPAAGGPGGSPSRRPPSRTRGLPRAWQVPGARPGPGPDRGTAARCSAGRCSAGRCSAGRYWAGRYWAGRYWAGRCSAGRCSAGRCSAGRGPVGRRPRRARRRRAVWAAARAEPHERVLTGRPHRHAWRWPCTRDAGRPGHPGDPAYRGPRSGSWRAGSGGSNRRARAGPAALGLGRTSAAAPRLPARNEPGRPRLAAPWPRRPAGAHATSRSRAAARGAAGRLPGAGP